MGSLSNLYISQSYQSLIHLATNNTASATLIDLQDGLGNSIGVSVNTGGDLYLSGSLTASLAKGYVWVGNGNDRTILVATSSFFSSGSGPTDITSLNAFTASQLNINAGYNQYTSSTNIRLNNLESTSASVNISISNLNASSASQQLQINSLIAATGSYVTSAITASSLVTASVNLNTITFTKGDASTFNITVDTGSGGTIDTGSFATTGSNTFYGDQVISGSGFNGLTVTNGIQADYFYTDGQGIFTPTLYGATVGLGKLQIEALDGVNINGNLTASLEQGYAWVGNSLNKTILVPTSSFGGGSTDISSLNQFTASQNTKNTTLEGVTSSLQAFTQSQQNLNSTFATTGSNVFIGNQVIAGNISAISASFLYVQTTYETASVIYSSGSNQFGDELTDIQTLSGSVKVQGSLTVNGTPVLTSSVDISSLNAFTASQNTKNTTLENVTASLQQFTASSLVTASVNLNTITFTKGDASTFNITVDTGSGGSTPAGTISSSAQITALGFVSSSVTASSLVTASIVGSTITFTKGDASQFNIVIPATSTSFTSSISVSGSITISGSIENVDYIDFNTASVTPAWKSGRVFWDNTDSCLGVYNVEQDITLQVGQEQWVRVRNNTGAPIVNGAVVRLVGAQGDNPLVVLAQSIQMSGSVADDNQVLGIATHTIENATDGYVTISGNVRGLNTNAYNEGDVLWVSSSAGLLTNVIPVAPYERIPVATVIKVGPGGSGIIFVAPQQPIDFGNLSSVEISGSYEVGDMWIYEGNVWKHVLKTELGLTTTSSFNQYTSSTNSRLTNLESTTASLDSSITNINTFTQSANQRIGSLEAATSSYVTSAITASSLITASVNLNTITFTKGDASTFNITVDTGSATGGAISVQDEGTILGNATSFNFNGAGVTATLSAGTASITIPGGGGSIDTGSFATTGSNVFTGDQTLIDAAGNTVTLTDTSGSLMLVAKSYTSASAHLTGSTNTQVNLIFKNNNNTADTIISGSNNIFVNPAAPTAGFKRYVSSGNVMLNASNVPQISGSMTFSPIMNNNYFGGNATTLTMRGPVSSSVWNINGNNVVGTINVGNTAANNAEAIRAGLTLNTNYVSGILNIVANRSTLTQPIVVQGNNLTSATLTAASSSIQYVNNIGGITITNLVSGSANSVATLSNAVYAINNIWAGIGNTITATGSSDSGDTSGGSYLRHMEWNSIFGNSNGINLPYAATGSNSLNATTIAGFSLSVTGSNPSSFANAFTNKGGSAFFGRYNAQDGNRAQSYQTIFAVGTGTANGQRKTGFLIDSGSNTFIEGTLNVSGSSTFNGNQRITGSLTMSGSILFVDRSGNDTNTYLGLNALGMGNAGAQPLAVGNTIAVAIGIGAMRFASGSNQNIAIGNNALLITTGSKNFAMGSEAMSANTLGSSNVAIGTSALQNNTTGDSSTAIGDSAAQFSSGSQNTFIGQYSGYNVTGSNNVIIGSYRGVAGEVISNNIILSDGQQNIKAQYSGSAWSFQDNIKLNKGTNKTTDIVSVNGSATVNNSLVTNASIILVTTQNSGTGPVYPAVVLNKGTGTFDIAHNFGGSLDVAYMIINPT